MGRYLDYVRTSLTIQKAFYLGGKKNARVSFEHMQALNLKLCKKGYPMASAYITAYLMDLYQEESFSKESFSKEVAAVIAFEKNYPFKGQAAAFHKQLAFEHALFSAALVYKGSGSPEDLMALQRLEQESIAPIYNKYSDALNRYRREGEKNVI